MEKFDIIIKTLFGLEGILAQEVTNCGGEEVQAINRAVICKGDLSLMYSLNVHLRTAIRVLKPIKKCKVRNEQELYDEVKKIKWFKFLTTADTLVVQAAVSGERFTHSKYVALKSKDAIVDQFRENTGRRPSVDTREPDLQINVHIAGDQCTISLDSTGQPLGKRGYRTEKNAAPLSETLAAGMILLSNWNMETTFLDPMCGSGTIPIEAALLLKNEAPGLRRKFNFQKWRDFDPRTWRQVISEAKKTQTRTTEIKIIGRDKDPATLKIARENARRAGVLDMIEFSHSDILQTEGEEAYHILINPPYGIRLEEEEEMKEFYSEVGSHLKHKYEGSDAWILSSNMAAIKRIGLKPSKKIVLFNGALECKFQKFELYRGSKKKKKIDSLPSESKE